MKNYFVTAIGTDCGKTFISAILCQALHADYWKPVQAGYPTDTEWMEGMIDGTCHPEQYLLNTPASPHYAAAQDKVSIRLEDFELPDTEHSLVIEGAGGMLVPLNNKDMVIDLARRFDAPVILVCNIYLGSINHSLLSIDYLKRSGLQVEGIILNGEETPSTEQIIRENCPWPVLLTVRPELNPGKQVINEYAGILSARLDKTNMQ